VRRERAAVKTADKRRPGKQCCCRFSPRYERASLPSLDSQQRHGHCQGRGREYLPRSQRDEVVTLALARGNCAGCQRFVNMREAVARGARELPRAVDLKR